METLSIIIPVFNEEKALKKTIQEMDGLLERSEFKIEIIFVNDASTDKSREILNGLTGPSHKVLHHETNRGYGAALKTGIKNASSEYICITDADGSYPNSEILRLALMLNDEYSMVVGARKENGAKEPFLRSFSKRVLRKLASYLAGISIPDLNSGLRVMKKDIVERYINILPDGFSFTTTITLAMLTNNYRVKYVPIEYFKREGKSKIRPIHDTFNFIQLIIRTVLYFSPLKVFVPLSLFLVLFAFLILIGSLVLTGKAMDVTFGVILMTAVMMLSIGMLADIIDKRLS